MIRHIRRIGQHQSVEWRIRLAAWVLAAVLAMLTLQRLGWQQLSHAIGTVLHALARATLLVVDAGWPLLLLAAAVAVGLVFTGPWAEGGEAP